MDIRIKVAGIQCIASCHETSSACENLLMLASLVAVPENMVRMGEAMTDASGCITEN